MVLFIELNYSLPLGGKGMTSVKTDNNLLKEQAVCFYNITRGKEIALTKPKRGPPPARCLQCRGGGGGSRHAQCNNDFVYIREKRKSPGAAKGCRLCSRDLLDGTPPCKRGRKRTQNWLGRREDGAIFICFSNKKKKKKKKQNQKREKTPPENPTKKGSK